MELHVVVAIAVGSLVFFGAYRWAERVWRRRVLMRAAARILPVAPASVRPPTDLELETVMGYNGWVFPGPLGAPAACERWPRRETRRAGATITDSDQSELYDSGYE